MQTSVHIKVGLEAFRFDTGRAGPAAADPNEVGEPLRPRDGARIVARLGPRELRRLEILVTTPGRRQLHGDEDIRRVLAQQISSGRVLVRPVEAKLHRVSGRIPPPIEFTPPEPVQNEIAETHGLLIELIDADGNPVPGEPFRIQLPDGTIETSSLDDEGKAHITGLERAGTCKVCFYERDAAAWDPV